MVVSYPRPTRLFGAVLLASAVSLLSHTAVRAQTYALSTVHSFVEPEAGPEAGVTFDASGNLYGTTYGSLNNYGTVYKIAAGTSAFSTLYTYTDSAMGSNLDGDLVIDGSGNLFGTTSGGGSSGDGTIFEIPASTHVLSTIITFTGANNGANPVAGLTLDGNGNLYGTTRFGGANNLGTVFKISPVQFGAVPYTLATVATFNGTNGSEPYGALTLNANGYLFGTTYAGGANNVGTVFDVATSSNTFSTLATFNTTNGSHPRAGVTLGSSGIVYGTSSDGGSASNGTVFKLTPNLAAANLYNLSTLATFTGAANGQYPYGALTRDSAGNLFGTTQTGGASNAGTVFKIAATNNALTTIATFNGPNGSVPHAGLTFDASGNLYGTTHYGGAGPDSDDGSVFKLTASAAPEPGVLSLLASAGLAVASGVGIRRRRWFRE